MRVTLPVRFHRAPCRYSNTGASGRAAGAHHACTCSPALPTGINFSTKLLGSSLAPHQVASVGRKIHSPCLDSMYAHPLRPTSINAPNSRRKERGQWKDLNKRKERGVFITCTLRQQSQFTKAMRPRTDPVCATAYQLNQSIQCSGLERFQIEWQLSQTLARQCEKRVRDCRCDRRQSRLTNTRRRGSTGHHVNLNTRHFTHA